jgi:uncharacterized protein YndB with AHSA1/START domain
VNVKAHPARSPALSPKKAKGAVRPSGIVLKKASATAKPRVAKAAGKSAAASAKSTVTKANGIKPNGAKPSDVKTNGAKTNGAKTSRAATLAKPAVASVAAKAPAAAARGARRASAPAASEPPHGASPSQPPKKTSRKSIKEAAGVSTEAVMRRTGKNWDDWFEVLDNAGAQTLDQRGIIAILAQKHGIGPWWQQMIAVGYESLRGKSEKSTAAEGFRISSSCVLDAPLNRVFRLWNDGAERARWLADDRFVVRGNSGDKLIRARWGKGASQIAVSFSEKSGKTQVSLEHHHIESESAAEQMKAYWAKKLGLLDQALVPRS